VNKYIQHRLYEQIHESLDAGHIQCIVHGVNISKGECVYTSADGTRTLQESLASMMTEEFDHIVLIQKHQLGGYSKYPFNFQKLAHANELESWLAPAKENGAPAHAGELDAFFDAGNKQNNQTDINQASEAANQMDSPQGWLREIIFRISELMQSEVKFAVIVDGLDWIADLFPGREHQLDIIEQINSWRQMACPSLLIIPKLDELTTYLHASEQDLNVLYFGNPPAPELEAALEEWMTVCQGELHVPLEDRLVLDDDDYRQLAAALKLKGYLLKNAHYFTIRALSAWYKHKQPNGAQIRGDLVDPNKFCKWFNKRLELPIEKIEWDDVLLKKDTKQSIDTLFQNFLDGKTKNTPKGLLLYGSPGTGKTFIAKALANRGGCTFMGLKLADIKGRHVGESGKNVQRIFAEARVAAPTLIFIDEIDSIFQARGSTNQDSFSQDIINQFLAEVDGVDTGLQKIFIIGSTNRPELIDSAVKSRLTPIEIELPNASILQDMLSAQLGEQSGLSKSQVNKLSERCAGLSGRDIKVLCGDIIEEQGNIDERIDQAMQKMRVRIVERIGAAGHIQLAPDQSGTGYQKLHGFQQRKEIIARIIQSIITPHPILREDNCTSNGILLYGAPGNGKTFFISCMAEEYGLDFLRISGSELAAPGEDMLIRQLDQLVNNAIRLSITGKGVLIFFDEFDAIANPRFITSKVRAALLGHIDRIVKTEKLVLAAATNFIDRLDKATIRSGRFDFHKNFENPDSKTTEALIRGFIGSHFCLEKENISELTNQLSKKNMSVADISTLVRVAKQFAVQKDPDACTPVQLSPSDLQASLKQISKSDE